jgi:hypothetical protein
LPFLAMMAMLKPGRDSRVFTLIRALQTSRLYA